MFADVGRAAARAAVLRQAREHGLVGRREQGARPRPSSTRRSSAALEFDEWIIAEEAVDGREIEVAVLGDTPPEASLAGRDRARARVLHVRGQVRGRRGAELVIPASARRCTDRRGAARSRCARSRRAGATAMARVDFFYEECGRGFLVNELNTIPGFTPISMYPKLWEATGLPYPRAARPPRRPRRAPRDAATAATQARGSPPAARGGPPGR